MMRRAENALEHLDRPASPADRDAVASAPGAASVRVWQVTSR